MNPKKESKSELISDSKSEKNGITSAITKATIQVAARMPAQEAQPTMVWFPLWRVPSKSLKKTKRAETEA